MGGGCWVVGVGITASSVNTPPKQVPVGGVWTASTHGQGTQQNKIVAACFKYVKDVDKTNGDFAQNDRDNHGGRIR